jgi:hypothetical protein
MSKLKFKLNGKNIIYIGDLHNYLSMDNDDHII